MLDLKRNWGLSTDNPVTALEHAWTMEMLAAQYRISARVLLIGKLDDIAKPREMLSESKGVRPETKPDRPRSWWHYVRPAIDAIINTLGGDKPWKTYARGSFVVVAGRDEGSIVYAKEQRFIEMDNVCVGEYICVRARVLEAHLSNDLWEAAIYDESDPVVPPEGYVCLHPGDDVSPSRENDTALRLTMARLTPAGLVNKPLVLLPATLDSIRHNYSERVNESVRKVVAKIRGRHIGKMLILHGPPGTGKTFMMRAIFTELSSLYNVVVAREPLAFISSGAFLDYTDNDKPNIFLLEDCDALLMPEMRAERLDTFSALNNTLSGLIGAGRDDLFFVTFNSPIDKIDEALAREGRLLGTINLDKLNKDEAALFEEKNEVSLGITEFPVALSTLYARMEDVSAVRQESKEKRVGFCS